MDQGNGTSPPDSSTSWRGVALLTSLAVLTLAVPSIAPVGAGAVALPTSLHLPAGHAGPRAPEHIGSTQGAGASGALSAAGNASLGVSILASRSAVDAGLPVVFSANVTDGSPRAYVWNFGDNVTSGLASPSHVYLSSGADTVFLRVIGKNGTMGTASVRISVSAQMILQPPASPPTGAPGVPIQFGATPMYGIPPYAFYWNFGDQNISRSPTPTHAYARAGIYLATLAVNDTVGGQYLFSESVLVSSPNGSAPTGGASSGLPWETIGLGAGAVAAAVVVGLTYRARRPKP